jgi:pyruvate dehydrogenase E2 component (dihydrolipoamide acetyltransferase)
MAFTLEVPELGENVDSVEVVAILVEVGNQVQLEQPVIEVETEKASVEVPSTVAGVVAEIHVRVGDSLVAGQPIVTIDEVGSAPREAGAEPAVTDPSAAERQAPVAAGSDEPAEESLAGQELRHDTTQGHGAGHAAETTMTVPDLGEGVDSVEVVEVFIAEGDMLDIDQPVMEVETEKASVEVPSTVVGTVTKVHIAKGQTLTTGNPIVTVVGSTSATDRAASDVTTESIEPRPGRDDDEPRSEVGSPTPRAPEPPIEHTVDAPLAVDSQRVLVPAAPSVRRFAREVGVDIADVVGTGPGGRISIDDVKAFANRLISQIAESPTGGRAPDLPDFEAWGPVRREPMTKIRQVTASNMARAWLTAPQVTNHDLVDVTELEELRKKYRARVEAAGGRLTLTAIMVKVAASALKVFPTLNASINPVDKEIIFKDYVHIGVAVDTERGLLVPVIRNADRKNITDISIELDDLASRARARKLKPDEMQGGTFSISNLGGIGGTGFSPIVNWPEVAILGVSRGRIEPVWNGDEFRPRLMLPLSLSYDHRLVDGADAARFLRWLAEALEQPLLLAIEG